MAEGAAGTVPGPRRQLEIANYRHVTLAGWYSLGTVPLVQLMLPV